MRVIEWAISDSLKDELRNHYKTAFSLSLKNEKPLEIARALTFDGLPKEVRLHDLDRFLHILNTKFTAGGIRGVGVEVGSGPGTFVAAFARMPLVEQIYGVEACEAIVRELMTSVVKDIAGSSESKVIGAIASFDRIEIPDNSVDFVFDFFSLHHSPDPRVTLTEIYRVLKPGGVVVCVDKARANALSEKDLQDLLDVEYPRETKIKMGLSADAFHTRRMNGEYEYRLKDWKEFFSSAGMSSVEHYNVVSVKGTGLRPTLEVTRSVAT